MWIAVRNEWISYHLLRISLSNTKKEFLPANEAYRDEVRQDLDRAVLVDLLRLRDGVMESLAISRDQWCAEPSVHGGKKTRIDTPT